MTLSGTKTTKANKVENQTKSEKQNITVGRLKGMPNCSGEAVAKRRSMP